MTQPDRERPGRYYRGPLIRTSPEEFDALEPADGDPAVASHFVVLHGEYDEEADAYRVEAYRSEPYGIEVEALLRVVDGDLEIHEITGIRISGPSPTNLTSTDLREVRLGEIRADARRWIADDSPVAYAVVGTEDVWWTPPQPPAAWRRELEQTHRPGRRGRNPVFYAQISRDYVDALNRGSAAPIRDLAARHGHNASTITDFIHEARQRGLLTPTRRGVAGGALTDKAKELLDGPR